MEYLKNEKKNVKAVLLSIKEYDDIQKEIDYYKNTIEKLQDELDAAEVEKIKSEGNSVQNFKVSDYVSNKDRAPGSKNLKKTARNRSGKNRRVYS